MSKTLNVKFVFHDQSKGRGIGVYGDNLLKNLKNIPEFNQSSVNPDLVHYTFFDIFYPTLKIDKTLPSVVTVHDVTPLVLSDRYPKGILSSFNLLRQWYQLRKASAIITDSHCSKKDIVKILKIDESKVFVTHLAANKLYERKITESEKQKIKAKYSLPEKFVLTIAAGPNPNKNLPSLAEVTERVNLPLVIVGGTINQKYEKPVAPELIDLVRLEVYQHLIRLDNVSNEDLAVIMSFATVYVQASLYEGFGIPVLEAMTASCPVVSSRSSSLPEVYHPDTITFNPKSLSSMEKAMKKFLKLGPKAKEIYIKKNKEKSKDFSWQKTAKETFEVYKKVYVQSK